MAYAKLAELPVQYGLYSSFMGVLIYWFFATSKDITIGVGFAQLFSVYDNLADHMYSPSLSCPPSLATSSFQCRLPIPTSKDTSLHLLLLS